MQAGKLLLFLMVLGSLSCKGPKPAEKEEPVSVTTAMGEQVMELDTSIWVIFQDSRGYFWYGSNGRGAYFHDGLNLWQYTTLEGLTSERIRGIQEDKKGNIYFDTPNGVSKFDGTKFETLIPTESATNQWKLNPNDLWFKGNGDHPGAYRYDGDTLYELEFSDFGPKITGDEYSTYSIYKDKKGHLWFGTLSAGVCRYDGTNLSWLFEPEMGEMEDGRVPATRSIIEDNDGMFWMSNILNRYDIQSDDSLMPGKISYKILDGIDPSQRKIKVVLPYFNSAVMDEKSGALWMTNYTEGVWKYEGNKLSQFPLKDGEKAVRIVSIFKDKQGFLWLATDNAGVWNWNGNGFEKTGL